MVNRANERPREVGRIGPAYQRFSTRPQAQIVGT